MAKPTGFIEFTREDAPKKPINVRIQDYREFEDRLPDERLTNQAARCMDCGVPSCHSYGCPTQNRIPDWNDLVYRDQWKMALEVLHSTDNFPEFTGRVCPAPCEAACTLGINQPAVTIRNIELQIIEKGWEEGWVVPQALTVSSGKKVAVIGSGPAGLSAAQNIARKGHKVVVFEKADRIGGLLRYGIPDFKLEKSVIDRRLEQMEKEGVRFEAGVDVGRDISVRYLKRTFDAVVIAAGSTIPRDLPVPGRDLDGVHFAMEFLTQQNMRNAGDKMNKATAICATNKHVVVIGGGDTGSDCVGTSTRQGAKSITQIELLPKPPENREENNPWPTWPNILRTSSSHQEGCDRDWSILIKEFVGSNGKVKALKAARLEWTKPENGGRPEFKEIPKSGYEIKADLVLLAMGFIHVEHGPLVKDFELDLNERGDIITDAKLQTSVPGVFAAGDAAMGASLVVRAIHQGRVVADGVDEFLANI
jgi:glutamate synthase (NADPH) small chain